MSRKIFLVLIAVLFLSGNPIFAAPVDLVPIIKVIPADQDISGMLVGDSAIYLFGNTPSGAYVSALNKDGTQKWLHDFSDSTSFTITAGSLDSAGNIWLAGASAAPIAIPSAASPSPTAANPEGVAVGEESSIRLDLNNLTLWKVTSAGEGAGKFQLPLSQPVLPTSISVNKTGISLVAWQANGSLFVTADLTGKFGKPLKIGKSDTTLDSVIRNPDNSSFLFGSSTELFLANKAIGNRDALILKVDATPKLAQSIRSGEKGAIRNWASATPTLLLGGYLKNATSSLATITKFTNLLKPSWSVRFKATSNAVVADGLNGVTYAAFGNAGSGTVLTFAKNGKITSTKSFTGSPIAIAFNKTLGLYIYSSTAIFNVATK